MINFVLDGNPTWSIQIPRKQKIYCGILGQARLYDDLLQSYMSHGSVLAKKKVKKGNVKNL